MKTTVKNKYINRAIKWLIVATLFIGLLAGCTKDGNDDEGIASRYSGSGNFNFSGDFDFSYLGNANNIQILQINGQESLPITFFDSQGKEFFFGLRSDKLEARAYTLKAIDSEGYSAIFLEGSLYDSGAIGGKGTVTISSLNKNKIKGTVDMRLARPLNTADTVEVKGSFELIGK